MARRSDAFWFGALVWSIGAMCSGIARADLVSPHERREPRGASRSDVIIDAGKLANRVAERYRIVKGDTIESIAKKHLGVAGLVPAIRALNPEIDGDTIIAGQFLRLPPKALAAAATPVNKETIDALIGKVLTLWTARRPNGALEAVLPDQPLVDCRSVAVFAIPGDRLATFLTAEHRFTIRYEGAKEDAAVARTEFLTTSPTIDDAGLIVAVTLKLASIEGQKLTVEESRATKGRLGAGSTSIVLPGAAAAAAALFLALLAIARSRRAPQPVAA